MTNLTRILVALMLAVFAVGPASVAVAANPSSGEYSYDPIPDPGNNGGGNGNGKNSSNDDANSTGVSGSGSSDDDYTGTGGTISSGDSGSTGEPDSKDRKKKAESEKKNDELKKKLAVEDEDSGDQNGAALAGAGSSSDDDDGSGSSGVFLIVGLILAAALVGGLLFYSRKRSDDVDSGSLIRLGAVGVVLVVLVSLGAGKAFAAKAPPSFFGMMTQSNVITETAAERMAKGGVTSIRIPVSWQHIQASPTSDFDWTAVDTNVANVSKAGLRVVPVMLATPKGFAGRPTVMPVSTTKQKQGWALFLRNAVRRYGPNGTFWTDNPDIPRRPIRTWQIWNEVNFHYFTTPVNPANYVKLLKQSTWALNQEDPGHHLMLSGLYGSPREIPRKAMKSWKYLQRLYSLGAKPYFDSVAVHPYTPDTPQLRALLRAVRATMIKNRDRQTPMHVTEIGWGSDRRTVFGMGSPAKQAKQLTSGFNLLIKMRGYLKLRSVYWYAFQDVPANVKTCNFCYSTGLFKPGEPLVAKPAWNAYVRLTGGRRG